MADNFMSMMDIAKANGIRVVLASVTPVCDCYNKQTGLNHRKDHQPERLDQGFRGSQRSGLSGLLFGAGRGTQFQEGTDR
jgi:hypothetical protein